MSPAVRTKQSDFYVFIYKRRAFNQRFNRKKAYKSASTLTQIKLN